MKTILMAAAATLALSTTAHAQAAGDWSGAYLGASFGWADRSESSSERIGFDTNLDGTYTDTVRTAAGADAFSPGFCGGSFVTNAAPGGCNGDDKTDLQWSVRGGYDLEFGSWVVGGLVEYSRLELSDAVTAFSVTPAAYNFTRKLTDVIAIRARGGYAFGDNLIYATGGYAVGNMKHSFRTTNTVNSFPASGGGDAKGYQFGVGAEHKFTPNVSVGVEYLRTSLKDDDFGVRAINSGTTPATNPFILQNAGGTGFLRTDDDFEFNSFRATLSWRF